jgi:hypothetical protein
MREFKSGKNILKYIECATATRSWTQNSKHEELYIQKDNERKMGKTLIK